MNLNKLDIISDQNAEHRPSECVGESVSAIVSNIIGKVCDPDFTEAAGFYVASLMPTTTGEDPYAAVAGAVAFGALLDTDDTSDPLQTSQLAESNFANYTVEQKARAAQNAMRGPAQMRSYQEIINFITTRQLPVALTIKWFQSFNYPLPDGRLRPAIPNEPYTIHCVAVYEATNDGLRIEPHLGRSYGENGYGFISEDVLNQCFINAFSFNPNAWRWLELVKLALLSYPQSLPKLLPIIQASATMRA